jgi:hypothetical protein
MRLLRKILPLLLIVGAVLLWPGPASACPFCEGGPSGRNEVQEAIFGDGFWFNFTAAALPFVVVAALVVVIHGGPTAREDAVATGRPEEGAVDGR